jgi:uncharacterized DUF497 family protein
MRIAFDPVKNARNIAERGLPFQLVADLEWQTAIVWEDDRREYGERRMRVLAFLGARLHAVVVIYRGDSTHVISFRKANRKESGWYDRERRCSETGRRCR